MKPFLAAIALAVFVTGMLASQAESAPMNYQSVQQIICQVFGAYCSQAIHVSSCETGGTFSVWARNGQYHGIFQMGSNERATYGDGNDAWAQAKAAYRYFIAAGRSWSPWTCRWAA